MPYAVLGDIVGRSRGPQVADTQAAPIQPADAPRAVAPGDLGTEGQFRGRVLIGTGQVDLGHHPCHTPVGVTGRRVFRVVLPEELLGLGGVHWVVRGRRWTGG